MEPPKNGTKTKQNALSLTFGKIAVMLGFKSTILKFKYSNQSSSPAYINITNLDCPFFKQDRTFFKKYSKVKYEIHK